MAAGLNLCIRAKEIPPSTILRVLVALVEIDVAIYRQRIVTRSPFTLRWVPDGFAGTSTLRDASILDDEGEGSCGELAAAYAAWHVVHKNGDGKLRLMHQPQDGRNAWHVASQLGDLVFDPQILGDPQNGNRHGVVR